VLLLSSLSPTCLNLITLLGKDNTFGAILVHATIFFFLDKILVHATMWLNLIGEPKELNLKICPKKLVCSNMVVREVFLVNY